MLTCCVLLITFFKLRVCKGHKIGQPLSYCYSFLCAFGIHVTHQNYCEFLFVITTMRSYNSFIVALVGALSLEIASAQLGRCHTTILTPQHFLNQTQVQHFPNLITIHVNHACITCGLIPVQQRLVSIANSHIQGLPNSTIELHLP